MVCPSGEKKLAVRIPQESLPEDADRCQGYE